jgi:hypothetical protein
METRPPIGRYWMELTCACARSVPAWVGAGFTRSRSLARIFRVTPTGSMWSSQLPDNQASNLAPIWVGRDIGPPLPTPFLQTPAEKNHQTMLMNPIDFPEIDKCPGGLGVVDGSPVLLLQRFTLLRWRHVVGQLPDLIAERDRNHVEFNPIADACLLQSWVVHDRVVRAVLRIRLR